MITFENVKQRPKPSSADVGVLSKHEIVQRWYPELLGEVVSIDFALPQRWLDWMVANGADRETIRKGSVWAYPKGSVDGEWFALTDDAFREGSCALEAYSAFRQSIEHVARTGEVSR